MRQLSESERSAVINRHAYHKPADDSVAAAHERVRELLTQVELELLALLPGPSRCASLVSTKLDEARMWANMALATNDGAPKT